MRGSSTLTALAALAAAALTVMGCSGAASSASTHSTDPKSLHVYATTGYLADAVANIAPDAEVTTMVGPGGDPHTYQPSTRDIQTLLNADLVVWNGLLLEAQMIEIIESRADRQLAVGNLVPDDLLIFLPETDATGRPFIDPHIWNSPDAWSIAVRGIADKLAAVDPAQASAYRANASAYVDEIAATAADVDALLASVPAPRILITGHDAFNYFGATYDLTVCATDVISSEAALSAGELSSLAALIAEHRVVTIFHDNQANPQAITSLSEAVAALGWQVNISDDPLYADSLGATPGVDTYLGVLEHNARTIASALTSNEGATP